MIEITPEDFEKQVAIVQCYADYVYFKSYMRDKYIKGYNGWKDPFAIYFPEWVKRYGI